MARIYFNPIVKSISRLLLGKMLKSGSKKRKRPMTPHQRMISSRFKEAIRYASLQMRKPAAQAEYASGITPRLTSAYVVALTDFLNAPTIEVVDTSLYHGYSHDLITIMAVDDFKVTSVRVEIRSAAGDLIEQGEALNDADRADRWTYSASRNTGATEGLRVTVRARDKAGNEAVNEVVL
jgi:hypothetical protein